MNQNEGTWSSFKRLVRMMPNKGLLKLGIGILFILSITEVLFSIVIQQMLDSAVKQDLDLFKIAFLFVLIIAILDVSLTFFSTNVLGKYTEKGIYDLKQNYANRLSRLKMSKLIQHHSGDYVSRGTNDVNKIKNFLSTTLPFMITNPISAFLALIYILYLNWILTLVCLSVIPILIFGIQIFSKHMGSISKDIQASLGNMTVETQDYIKGVEVSKIYQMESLLSSQYNQNVDQTIKKGNQLALRRSILDTYSQLIGFLPFFITFLLGGYYAIHGQMTAGSLIAFINLLNPIVSSITRLPQYYAQTKMDLASANRIFEVLDDEEEKSGGGEGTLNSDPIVSFHDVSFQLDTKTILNHLSFSVKKGEKIAFVGPSGGGKSTILRLILGYYETYQGEIKIGTLELNDWDLKCLRDTMAIVSQDTYLFPESIRTNIGYGKENSTNETIQMAADQAYASTFINHFELGIDTEIGELGNRLSGGQKQRLSIARAICKNADLLLLDEATSALDNESEQIVQEALEQLMEGKTSIIIAHRLSTIRNVDRILVVSEGKIIEEGTHEYLIEKGGIYKDLYETQNHLNERGGV